jgi:hypothetical protein
MDTKHTNVANIRWWNGLTLSWLSPLMLAGARQPLTPEDLPLLPDSFHASSLAALLRPFWLSPSAPSLSRVFRHRFWAQFVLACLCQGISISCTLTIPSVIRQIILFLTPVPNVPGAREAITAELWVSSGYALAGILLALQVGGTLFGRSAEQLIRTAELHVKTMVIGAVYEKSLKKLASANSSNNNNGKDAPPTQGRILNLINVDAEKISMVLSGLNAIWSTPVQITVALVQLAQLLGVSVWAGAATLFAVLLLQGFVVFGFIRYQKAFLKAGDERLKATRELLYGESFVHCCKARW